jgi:Amt family ammonium transporter
LNFPQNPDSDQPWLMADVLACLPEAVAVVRGNQVQYVNAAFTRIFGFTAEEVAGRSLRELIVPEVRRQQSVQLGKATDQFGFASLETVRRNKNGELLDVAIEVRPLVVNGGRAGYIYTFLDIGERKRAEVQLQHDALHDSLTELPNRALFLDRLSLAFTRRARHRGQNCGVLFLDLDHFKEINDSLGHAAGDEVLRSVAARLRGALRPQDTAARLGGDEFVILVEDILSVADIEIVANRILREMERGFEVGGRSFYVSASVGVAIAGPDHVAPEMLVRDADFAMYCAKEAGGGRFEIFNKQLEVAASSLQERERELRQVLEDRRFEVRYQPICALQTGSFRTVRLEGFESLLCWRKADGSVASFSDLLTVAEETGLSISLGRETMEAVCAQLRSWADALPQAALSLSINLTLRQFYHPDLIALVKRTLAVSGADPARLLFEVGEKALSENPEAAAAILERLLGCNVRLAVDDFGIGLAPLNHLVRLPIDVLKLDPRLTLAATQAGTQPSRQVAVLETLIELGRKLGVQVVAQGIETLEQLETLAAMGCELGQGPLLSPALEPWQAQKLAEQGSWRIAPEAEPGS